jgi:hypothetical protein
VDTATCLASPTADWARRKEIFDACALYRATPDHAKIRGLETKLRVRVIPFMMGKLRETNSP